MKERYTLVVSSILNAGANTSYEYTFDLKQLLPLNLLDKKFLLRSSFNVLVSMGATEYSSFVVYVETKDYCLQHNRSSPTSTYLPLGVAIPVQCSTGNYTYAYSQATCVPLTITYPNNSSTLKLKVESRSNNVDVAYDFLLSLSFEVLD